MTPSNSTQVIQLHSFTANQKQLEATNASQKTLCQLVGSHSLQTLTKSGLLQKQPGMHLPVRSAGLIQEHGPAVTSVGDTTELDGTNVAASKRHSTTPPRRSHRRACTPPRAAHTVKLMTRSTSPPLPLNSAAYLAKDMLASACPESGKLTRSDHILGSPKSPSMAARQQPRARDLVRLRRN